MAIKPSPGTAVWSSKFAFIMAAVGSSVGLGNLWRFSAEAGRSGGGAFILMYVVFVLLIGIPVLMSEFTIGRSGNAPSAIGSVKDIARRSNRSERWGILGVTGMIGSFLIVSFYCVVAAWVIMYIPKFLSGSFAGETPAQIAQVFEDTLNNKPAIIPYFTGFAFLTTFLVARGVNKGIEFASTILMPLFFILLICLAFYSLYTGFHTPIVVDNVQTNGSKQAFKFLFAFDFSKVTPAIMTAALGQAFFSIGLGSAIMITYGSYLPQNVSIPRSAVIIGLTDTLVAIIAGLAIFPIVFSHNLPVNEGSGLFFTTLPNALAEAPWIGAAFFFLAIFAAVTSSISLLEPTVAWVSERFSLSRVKSACLAGGAMWLLGFASIYKFIVPGIHRLDDKGILRDVDLMTFLDEMLTSAIMLPLTGLLTVLFVGWRMKRSMVDTQLGDLPRPAENLVYFLVRFIAPIAIALVLIFSIDGQYFNGTLANLLSLL